MAAMLDRARGALQRLKAGFLHAFAVAPAEPLRPDDLALLDRVAAAIRRRRMEAAALLFLESVKPLNFVGSQALVFLRPFATMVLRSPEDYDRFVRILERRDGLEALLQRLEAKGPEPVETQSSREELRSGTEREGRA